MAHHFYMGLYNAAEMFRQKARGYLEMMRYVSDEQQRQILYRLFEDNEAKAKLFEDDTPQIRPSHLGHGQPH